MLKLKEQSRFEDPETAARELIRIVRTQLRPDWPYDYTGKPILISYTNPAARSPNTPQAAILRSPTNGSRSTRAAAALRF